jgi:hypothetical protein
MKEAIETLIENQKRKLRSINKQMYEKADKKTLKIKKAMCQNFISELERIINNENQNP